MNEKLGQMGEFQRLNRFGQNKKQGKVVVLRRRREKGNCDILNLSNKSLSGRITDQGDAERTLLRIKQFILNAPSDAFLVYKNLDRKGPHVVWVHDK